MNIKFPAVINADYSAKYENVIVTLAITLFPLFYLVFKGWINTFVFVLFGLSLIHFLRLPKSAWTFKEFTRLEWAVILGLCASFLAILISQLCRLNIVPKPFDGPLRMLLCAPIFLFLLKKKLSLMSVFQYVLPLSLIILWGYLQIHPIDNPMWHGRFGTDFVDPNTLGVQTMLMTSMCFFTIDALGKDSLRLKLLKNVGVFVGLYFVYKSETRGAWLVMPFMLILWVFIHGQSKSKLALYLLCGLSFSMIMGMYFFVEPFQIRVNAAYAEVSGWINKTNTETSAGWRLSFWQMSWILFKLKPLYGYGDLGYQVHLLIPEIQNTFSKTAISMMGQVGSHSEYLANMVRSGIFGLIAVLAEFLIPAIIFLFGSRSINPEVKNTSAMGLCLVLGMMICGLSLEVLNLKYVSSFYGLMIATLSASVLWKRPITCNH